MSDRPRTLASDAVEGAAIAALPHRPRRGRRTAALRDTLAETVVRPEDLILPTFVAAEPGLLGPVPSLPGVERRDVEGVLRQVDRALQAGVRWAMIFGVVGEHAKDADAGSADDRRGPVASAVEALKRAFGDDLVVVTDVCLCAYTDHGHCGLLAPGPRYARELAIDNDASLGRLAAMALAHAAAGVDVVAPSDMMDGRVAALRGALDRAGAQHVAIMSYAVKYASAFYGPFRDAAGSSPGPAGAHGTSSDGKGADGRGADVTAGSVVPADRATYQMDARNAREALREAALDEAEGADLLLVKPALPYLDVLARLRPTTALPLVAYQVSGEYAMIKAAARAGVLDEARATREALTSIRRAGADLIVSYGAVEATLSGWLA